MQIQTGDLYQHRIQWLPATDNVAATATKEIGRSDLSEDQVSVYDSIMSWHDDPNGRQYLKVGGLAGTGKTTLIAAVARELERVNGIHICYAAFTGKAVNVLSKKLNNAGIYGQCSTLHSLMYVPAVDDNGNISGWEKRPALPFDMVVVDEASMVGADLWQDLLSYGLPVLAVGDHGQLPPIGDSVVNLMMSPDLRLERIHRQAEGNPIIAFAQWVRNGKSARNFQPSDSRVTFVRSFAEIVGDVVKDADNFAAICYTNKTRVAINTLARRTLGRMLHDPCEGDTVICLKNRKPIFNGMRGVLTSVSEDINEWGGQGVHVSFPDDKLSVVTRTQKQQFNQPKTIDKLDAISDSNGQHPNSWHRLGMFFDYGYGMTCHKAQGSQFAKVVVIPDGALAYADADMRNRWWYTAGTRAAEMLYVVR